MSTKPLDGRVALVAGATRGCGRAIAVELARAGAYVYATGRSSRMHGRSEIDRPETIEETGELIGAAGGDGAALRVDHLEIEEVEALVARIGSERGRLDVLVNDIFGGDRYAQWETPLWRHDLAGGLRMLQMGVHTHLVTIARAMPLVLETGAGLVVEMTDGTHAYNRGYRQGVGPYYDLVKANVERIMVGVAVELEDTDTTAVAVTPGWIRSEAMLDHYGVTEATWRDALQQTPGFAISESPTFVARGVAALAADAGRRRFAGQVLTSHGLAVEYGHSDADGSRPDAWGHIAAGSPDPIDEWRSLARPRLVSDEWLLGAAAQILAEVGPADFTLAHAARRAGVSAATYVKRFGSKRGLFLALNRRWVDSLEAGVDAAVSGHSGLDRVREAAMWGVAEMDVPEHAANQLATLALDLTDADLQALLDRGWTAQRRHLTALLDDVARDRALPHAPEPEQAARMLLALVEGTRIAWCVHPDGSLEARVRLHVDGLLTSWGGGART